MLLFAASAVLAFAASAALALALAGQLVAWGAAINRIHSLGWPRWAIKLLTLLLHAAMLGAGAQVLRWGVTGEWQPLSVGGQPEIPWWMACYLVSCLAVLAAAVPAWWGRRALGRPPAVLLSNHTDSLDMRRRLGVPLAGGPLCRLVLGLPGNECLRLDVNEKTLVLPGLPRSLDGLSIAHLSDLHFTGKIGQAFFEAAVDLLNDMNADLVAVTGDLVDRNACIGWVPATLGRLRSRFGTYYVLGNHDRRVHLPRLRHALHAAGLIEMGGCWRLLEIDGNPLVLAGDERPWFRPQGGMPTCPFELGDRPALRVLLAHTPDRLPWARRQKFDLLLAGHTHGGQVRLPLLGPVAAPSRHGVRYASGTFHEPPTVMHVSRGLSGLHLLRWNCPPELTKLVLRTAGTN